MTKRILACLSEWGYWGEELVGPYDVLIARGYQIDFTTPNGRKPPALPPSMEEGYLDPPLDKEVTVILSQSDSERPLCGIYFNLHSPYQRKSLPRTVKPIMPDKAGEGDDK